MKPYCEDLLAKYLPASLAEQWNHEQMEAAGRTYLNIEVPLKQWSLEEGIDVEIVRERMVKAADETAAAKVARFTPAIMRQVEKSILLQSIDGLWRDHLVTLDHLSKVVGWRGLAQRDPLNEYKQEAYELFQKLLGDLRELVTTQLSHVEIQMRPPEPQQPDFSGLSEIHIDSDTGENELAAPLTIAGVLGAAAATGALRGGGDVALRPVDPKLLVGVSRNAPCPCGSGKKFKHCHGSF